MHGWAAHQVVLIHEAHNVMVHTLLSDVSWEAVHVVCDLAVGKVFQQDFGCLIAAFPRCQKQGSLLLKYKVKAPSVM